MDIIRDSIVGLPENVLLALLLVFAVGQVSERISQRWEWAGDVVNGVLFGLAAILCMSFPLEPQPGVRVDLRSLVVFLAGPFAGPIAASVAAAIAGGYRIWLGGMGALAGVGGVVTAAILGSLIWKFHGLLSSWRAALLAGVALSVTTIPWFLAIGSLENGWALMKGTGPTLAFLYVVGTVAIARLLVSGERRLIRTRMLADDVRRLRDIANVAFDWSWEVDADLRFTDVSRMAQGSHFEPADLVGKRLEDLFGEAKRRIWKTHGATLEQHKPFRDIVLKVRTEAGELRHLAISGKPVFDKAGNFAGYRGSGRDVTEESRQRDELLQQANTDWLTGAMNRRSIEALLAAEAERVRRYGRTMSLILFDIDGFKQVNDRNGHAAGDAVLREVTETVNGRLRANDMLGRLGGDEFLVLLPEANAEGAAAVAEDLRTDVESSTFGDGLNVTLSLGAAECMPGAETADLLNAADAALYVAKARGKNRVVVAGEPPAVAPDEPARTKNPTGKKSA